LPPPSKPDFGQEEVGLQPPPEQQNMTGFPLVMPKGFSVSVFAKDLSGGVMYISDDKAGVIYKVTYKS